MEILPTINLVLILGNFNYKLGSSLILFYFLIILKVFLKVINGISRSVNRRIG
jgi:hypothetical protein